MNTRLDELMDIQYELGLKLTQDESEELNFLMDDMYEVDEWDIDVIVIYAPLALN